MGQILTPDDFPAVRDLINTDTSAVSDDTLDSFPFLGYVESIVKDAITDWSTIMGASGAGDDQTYLRTGTAAMLALRVTSRLRASSSTSGGFKVGGYSEQGQSIDWDIVVGELKELVRRAFSAISTRTRNRPKALLASGPTSSGAIVPSEWEQWLEKIIPRVVDWLEEDGEDDPWTS